MTKHELLRIIVSQELDTPLAVDFVDCSLAVVFQETEGLEHDLFRLTLED